MYCIHWYKQ